ncbi:MAG: hypothetical protein R3B45_10485 [Bdellovibrionota bacterium]
MIKKFSIIFIMGSFLILGSSCNLFKTTKKNEHTLNKKSSLLDRNQPASIDRIEQRKSIQMIFHTTEEAFCRISYWPLNPNQKSSNIEALKIDCPNSQPSDSFDIIIKDLDPTFTYRFSIEAWIKGSEASKYEPYVIDESQSGHTNFGNVKAQSIAVASVDLTLGEANIHRFEYSNIAQLDEIQASLSPQKGCTHNKPKIEIYEQEAKLIKINGLVSRGYATGIGKAWPNRDDMIRIEFQKTYQPADQWEWNYKLYDNDISFTLKPPARFISTQIESVDLKILDTTNFDREEKELKIDPTMPLKINWTSKNNNENSLVYVQIGHSSLPSALYCIYDGKSQNITIDPSSFRDLPNGMHFLTITIQQSYFQKFKEKNTPIWLMKTREWRSIKIKK